MPKGDPQVLKISWDGYMKLVDQLCIRLTDLQKVDTVKVIRGIPRGGSILAVILSHRLGIPLQDLTNDHRQPILWVDDIVDTGATVSSYLIPEEDIVASLCYRYGCPVVPDAYALLVEPGVHIQFPYESDRSTY